MAKPEPPFEYCALRFLLQWEQRERTLHEQISGAPTLNDVRAALRYFQVARTFPGLGKDEAAQAVADSLQEIDSDVTLSPEAKVCALASRFRERFNRFNVSAASKLFWLRHRPPYIIFDSRVAAALRRLGGVLDDTNYARYCECWRRQYKRHEVAIEKATSRLPEVRAFLPAWHRSEDELSSLASQSWFVERVFDTYLWELGGEG